MIRVVADYLPDDLKGPQEAEEKEVLKIEGETLDNEEIEEEMDQEPELEWDDVCGEDKTIALSTGPPSESESSDDSEDAIQKSPLADDKNKKKVRMTTNKQKIGKNFYDTANVKNRNRSKKGAKNDKKQDQARLTRALKGDTKWLVE